jgi:hypothetical protein
LTVQASLICHHNDVLSGWGQSGLQRAGVLCPLAAQVRSKP